MVYKNCPEEYYFNCSAAPWRCDKCCACTNNKKDKLMYAPKSSSGALKNHPALLMEDSLPENPVKPNSNAKKGRAKERDLVKQLKAKPTINSGAFLQDGDFKLLDSKLQVDSKVHSGSHSFTLTKEEYTKGKQQGTNCWIISNKGGKQVAILDFATFKWICQVLAEQEF